MSDQEKQDAIDAARYRWLKDASGAEWDTIFFNAFITGRLDEALDADMADAKADA